MGSTVSNSRPSGRQAVLLSVAAGAVPASLGTVGRRPTLGGESLPRSSLAVSGSPHPPPNPAFCVHLRVLILDPLSAYWLIEFNLLLFLAE